LKLAYFSTRGSMGQPWLHYFSECRSSAWCLM